MDLKIGEAVVFVAGSSRGIGRGIAEALLAEGARVVLTGRGAESLEQTAAEMRGNFGADRVLAIAGDFGDGDVIEDAYAQTVKRFGRIDHLVANLGTGRGTPGPLPPADDWQRLFAENFFASTRLTELVLPRMQQQKSGNILYISSITAVEATAAPLPYSAAKAALTNYAKNLSRLVAADNIRVNTICPGNILFEGGSWEKRLETNAAAVEAMLEREVPQRRLGTVEEIASLAAYLCSPLAGFATGGTFVVDGGQTRSL